MRLDLQSFVLTILLSSVVTQTTEAGMCFGRYKKSSHRPCRKIMRGGNYSDVNHCCEEGGRAWADDDLALNCKPCSAWTTTPLVAPISPVEPPSHTQAPRDDLHHAGVKETTAEVALKHDETVVDTKAAEADVHVQDPQEPQDPVQPGRQGYGDEPGFQEWGEWQACSASCGHGWEQRTRKCSNEETNCKGPEKQVRPCLLSDPCVVDGGWSEWKNWTSCSKTCDAGTQSRGRACDNPTPQYGGRDCHGQLSDERHCNLGPCPVDGGWGEWSKLSECSATCGSSVRTQHRECDNPLPLHGGKTCVGESKHAVPCDGMSACPVDGNWGQWTAWSECTVTCGMGRIHRTRHCNNPPPLHGGRDCPADGKRREVEHCWRGPKCPIDGGWSEWSKWSKCFALPCERGTKRRIRNCTSPSPQYGGHYCKGNFIDIEECINSEECPVDGGWSDWSDWGPCSATCGLNSVQQCVRHCNDPVPMNGGRSCSGAPSQYRDCSQFGLPPCEENPVTTVSSVDQVGKIDDELDEIDEIDDGGCSDDGSEGSGCTWRMDYGEFADDEDIDETGSGLSDENSGDKGDTHLPPSTGDFPQDFMRWRKMIFQQTDQKHSQ